LCATEYEKVASTSYDLWEHFLFFELVEPEEIAYVYKIKPAKNFGVALVSQRSHLFIVEVLLTT